jgi:hypothetical protein
MASIKDLQKQVEELTAQLAVAREVKPVVVVVEKAGKKAQALQLLMSHESLKSQRFADLLGIKVRNMQSVVHYLRDDGWAISEGGVYALQVNQKLIDFVHANANAAAFLRDRVGEYEAILAYRAAKSAPAAE